MGWSYQICRVFGIRIKLHAFFLIFVGALVLEALVRENAQAAADTLLLLCLLFGCVVLHELAHSLMARREGAHVYDITLLPIGGVARLANVPEDPGAELRIAVVGPAVNVVIALFLIPLTFLAFVAEDGFGPRPTFTVMPLLFNLVAINLMLAFFNVLPAFPMDGGRILRALLARRYGYLNATEKAARIGRWLALFMGVFGVIALHRFWLAVIALFIYFAGAQELAAVRLNAARRAAAYGPSASGAAAGPPLTGSRATSLTDAQAAEQLAALARQLDDIRGK